MTTYDGEILFNIPYGGASFSGPGRFDSEILQTAVTSQAKLDLTDGYATLSEDISTKKYISADGYRKSNSSVQSQINTSNYYVNHSVYNYSFASTYRSPGSKLQKLYNTKSRKFITYYSMVAKDSGAQMLTYKYWVRQGTPGTVANYPGNDAVGPLTDLAIAAKWKVFIG